MQYIGPDGIVDGFRIWELSMMYYEYDPLKDNDTLELRMNYGEPDST